MIEVKFKRLQEFALLPTRATEGSACFDVYACLDAPFVLDPGKCELIPTGLAMEIPCGYEVQIRPRSSMGRRKIIIPNTPATIDADFRGHLAVILMNLSDEPYIINHRDRIAQMKLSEVPVMVPVWVDELSSTERGEGGIGSTGR